MDTFRRRRPLTASVSRFIQAYDREYETFASQAVGWEIKLKEAEFLTRHMAKPTPLLTATCSDILGHLAAVLSRQCPLVTRLVGVIHQAIYSRELSYIAPKDSVAPELRGFLMRQPFFAWVQDLQAEVAILRSQADLFSAKGNFQPGLLWEKLTDTDRNTLLSSVFRRDSSLAPPVYNRAINDLSKEEQLGLIDWVVKSLMESGGKAVASQIASSVLENCAQGGIETTVEMSNIMHKALQHLENTARLPSADIVKQLAMKLGAEDQEGVSGKLFASLVEHHQSIVEVVKRVQRSSKVDIIGAVDQNMEIRQKLQRALNDKARLQKQLADMEGQVELLQYALKEHEENLTLRGVPSVSRASLRPVPQSRSAKEALAKAVQADPMEIAMVQVAQGNDEIICAVARSIESTLGERVGFDTKSIRLNVKREQIRDAVLKGMMTALDAVGPQSGVLAEISALIDQVLTQAAKSEGPVDIRGVTAMMIGAFRTFILEKAVREGGSSVAGMSAKKVLGSVLKALNAGQVEDEESIQAALLVGSQGMGSAGQTVAHLSVSIDKRMEEVNKHILALQSELADLQHRSKKSVESAAPSVASEKWGILRNRFGKAKRGTVVKLKSRDIPKVVKSVFTGTNFTADAVKSLRSSQWLVKFVYSVLIEYIPIHSAEDEGIDWFEHDFPDSTCMNQACYAQLLNKFGLPSIADSHMMGIFLALSKHWRTHPRLRTFALLCDICKCEEVNDHMASMRASNAAKAAAEKARAMCWSLTDCPSNGAVHFYCFAMHCVGEAVAISQQRQTAAARPQSIPSEDTVWEIDIGTALTAATRILAQWKEEVVSEILSRLQDATHSVNRPDRSRSLVFTSPDASPGSDSALPDQARIRSSSVAMTTGSQAGLVRQLTKQQLLFEPATSPDAPPVQEQANSFINVDVFLDIMLDEWMKENGRRVELVKSLFRGGDYERSGRLTCAEFATLVRTISPKLRAHEATSMFRDAVKLSGGDVLDEHAFVKVIRRRGLMEMILRRHDLMGTSQPVEPYEELGRAWSSQQGYCKQQIQTLREEGAVCEVRGDNCPECCEMRIVRFEELLQSKDPAQLSTAWESFNLIINALQQASLSVGRRKLGSVALKRAPGKRRSALLPVMGGAAVKPQDKK